MGIASHLCIRRRDGGNLRTIILGIRVMQWMLALLQISTPYQASCYIFTTCVWNYVIIKKNSKIFIENCQNGSQFHLGNCQLGAICGKKTYRWGDTERGKDNRLELTHLEGPQSELISQSVL